MNKQEIAVVVLLFMLLIGWGVLQKRMAPAPRSQTPPEALASGGSNAVPGMASGVAPETPAETAVPAEILQTPAEAPVAPPAAEPVESEGRELPEERVVLSNEEASITVSSWGGGITSVELKRYRERLAKDSGPVRLDFSAAPALAISGLPGLTTNSDFSIEVSDDGRAVRLERVLDSGLALTRTLAMADTYALTVTDVFSNRGEGPLSVPLHGVGLGPMGSIQTKAKVRGMSYLGIDTLPAHGGEGVTFWAKKRKSPLHKAFSAQEGGAMAPRASLRIKQPVVWAAAKNKFFVQIIEPENGAADCELHATRDPESKKRLMLSTVRASVLFSDLVLQPGDSHTQTARYFVGPKKYAILKTLGQHQDEVMQFGFFKPVCKPLLWILNRIHALLPNYGVAIILLTVLVRLVFWPVTHKSTESMKKMQAIQPLVNKVREKYKDKPQKMNQEVMALYKEHKVNPMAGCLPMVIQIPVFIALFTVLRSAVELRFAPFLWIRDLSEPEGLLAGMIPLVPTNSLNILPLFMTGLTVAQQRMTPTAGDPQQQKMMMLMPIFFLFIFYSMPSALVLYWSTSQALAVVQLVMQRRKKSAEEEGPGVKDRPAKTAPAPKKGKRRK